MKEKCALLLSMLAVVLLSQRASAVELVLNPRPQVTKDTCQSYQIAYALASTGDAAYQAETTKQLRKQESDFRSVLVEVANKAPGDRQGKTSDHVNWQEAVRIYTKGRYVLRDQFYKSVGHLYAAVAEKTGNRAVQVTGAALSAITVRQPVFTSIQSVDGNTYGAGHIVALFGVSYPANMSPGPDQKLPLAVLNSAIKVGNSTGNMCHAADGDNRYRAEVYVTETYELKQFQNLGYNLLWLERASQK